VRTQPTLSNQVELIRNGFEFIQSNLELIKDAKNFIFLHTYIFEVDETTKPIIKQLIEASKRGVEVYIILDALGSQDFPEKTEQDLVKAGVRIKYFTPLFHFYRTARRMHQKLLLIDNEKAIVGGINLARRFNNPDQNLPWLDYSVLITGEEVHNLYLKSLRHYTKYFKDKRSQILNWKGIHSLSSTQCIVKSIENDWIFQYKEVTQSYLQSISEAKVRIIIMATYFLPGKRLLKELKKARKRDVEVLLIFGAFSDHPVVQAAERYFFDWYLQIGFKIYLWDRSIVHGKLALIDDTWVSIGSYNHNFLSKFGNCELNLEIINNQFASDVEKEINNVLQKCKPVTNETSQKYSKSVGILTYILLNILTLFSLIFLYRQSEEEMENISR
tara:strand:- start:13761 stop:14921 length:1161 start_codon:yes stop_codon:yes gene_type:complete